MKLRTIIKSSLLAVFVAGLVATIGSAHVSAAQIPYEKIGTDAPTTPAFNIYSGVPVGIGDESDFVKLRNSNGNPQVPATQGAFVDPLSVACAPGSMFDVRTYVHNGADEDHNNNGTGTAVAKNTKLAMTAQLGVNKKNFDFTSTVSASNAASVTDTGRLNCSEEVYLELVPKTVYAYSTPTGWTGIPDSAVNGSTAIGSRVPGSGDVWGCFGDRVVVVYTVVAKKKEVPPTPPTPTKPVTPVTTLPKTGAGSVVGIVASTTVAAAAGHRLYYGLRRRFNV